MLQITSRIIKYEHFQLNIYNCLQIQCNNTFFQIVRNSFVQICYMLRNEKLIHHKLFIIMIQLVNRFSTQKNMIYFIRHAQSKYNIVDAELQKKFGQNYKKQIQYINQKFSKDYLDVEITEKGYQQALQCRQKMKDIDLGLIIVSPLRRALKTCQIVFENHKSNAPVIVDPAFREILCSSNDVGSKLTESKTKFTKFDFSLVTDPDFWYLQTIHDDEIRQRLMKRVQEVKQDKNRVQEGIEITLQFLRQYFKLREADPTNPLLMKKVLPSLKKQKQILEQKLSKYRSIAVVSHSQNIRVYVGYKPNNCEIVPFSEQQLKALKID